MGRAVRVIEIVSYGLITLIGARLVWVKGAGFIRALQKTPVFHHAGDHEHGGHQPCGGTHIHHGHGHAAGSCQHADHTSAWGHAHGPEPADLAGRGGWRRGMAAIVAVGLRPCSGAIIVLVFALAQDVFAIGIGATLVMGLGTAVTVTAIATLAVFARGAAARLAATRPGIGMIALRGLEAAAAFALLMFGLLLLVGYLASERLPGGF
jgi:nickel/cobalt exporter